jgi:hypothetical protein
MGGKGEAEVTRNEDVLVGLQGQYARLVGLVQGLGVEVEKEDNEPRIERRVLAPHTACLLSSVGLTTYDTGSSTPTCQHPIFLGQATSLHHPNRRHTYG